MVGTIYKPREDSELLGKYVSSLASGVVLDIGTGSGYQVKAALASKKVKFVIGVDIQQKAVDFCDEHIKDKRVFFLQSDLFSFFDKNYFDVEKLKIVKCGERNKFDTIIFNPPYLPEDVRVKDITLDGGKKGYEVIERFLKNVGKYLAKDGRVLLLFSSLTKREKVDELVKKNGLSSRLLGKKHVFFEDLYVYCLNL